MRYCEHQPSPRLARYLECIWFLTNDSSTPGTTPERVFPDGCIEWTFHLGQRFRLWHAAQWELQPISFVVGELTRFLLLQPSGSVATMGVRFRPGGAYRFLPCPVNVITNKLISTGDIWGGAGEALERQVLTANDDRERISQIEAFLLERLAGVEARPRFDLAVKEILWHRGQKRVDDLAAEVGCSARQLEREFLVSAGLSPKALARIIRFQNLLRLVGEGTLREWTSLALEVGYADQPHMVREFRQFAGQTPTEQQTASGNLASHFISPQRLSVLLG